MAKHGRRKFRRYIRGNIDHKIDLGTLGAGSVGATNVADEVIDTTWCSSVDATWTIDNWTKTANVGPCLVGACHSDYTVTEIEQFLEELGNWDPGDLIVKERMTRKIRTAGVITPGDGIGDAGTFAHGARKRLKMNIMLHEGDTVKFWVYNMGGVAFGTTDPNFRIQGHANLWPK